MPTIICNYCEYVGSGNDFADRIQDVERHEQICPAKPEEEVFIPPDDIDPNYEAMKADLS